MSRSLPYLLFALLAVAACSKKESAAPPVTASPMPAPAAASPAATAEAQPAPALPEDRLEPAPLDKARLPGGAELVTEPGGARKAK